MFDFCIQVFNLFVAVEELTTSRRFGSVDSMDCHEHDIKLQFVGPQPRREFISTHFHLDGAMLSIK